MRVSRRKFLAGAGAAAAGVAAQGCAAAEPEKTPVGAAEAKKETKRAVRYAMVIDLRRCFGCHACAVACNAEQGVPLGYHKSWVITGEKGSYPAARRGFIPVLCNHCKNPPCVEACPVEPVKATLQRDDGIVSQSNERCINCFGCFLACPYHVKYSDPKLKKLQKCDFCLHRVEQGLLPACVNTCNAKARIFGDLNDPESAVSRLVAANPVKVLLPDKGTEPQVFYIGLDETMYKGVVSQDPRDED